ncbi:MAG: DUF3795 domain-containing protein [Oscillospiraceae bacterium]|nr:DUF3795 domain-containing protein [Oscillospiraceae bacterium]
MQSICGIDCTKCEWKQDCAGCAKTNGQPFGKACVIAAHCQQGETALHEWKQMILAAIRELRIQDMEEITELHGLKGSFVNLAYGLPSGQTVKFWDDDKIYLGNQLHKKDSDRCYGVVADESYLLVAEYGCCGVDAEIVVFKRWNQTKGD